MRPIDADRLETHEQLEPFGNGNYEYVEVVYKDDIDNAPTIEAQPERKKGKWINDEHDMPRCSCCGYMPEYNRHIDDYYYSDWCPNCGARMEVDEK